MTWPGGDADAARRSRDPERPIAGNLGPPYRGDELVDVAQTLRPRVGGVEAALQR